MNAYLTMRDMINDLPKEVYFLSLMRCVNLLLQLSVLRCLHCAQGRFEVMSFFRGVIHRFAFRCWAGDEGDYSCMFRDISNAFCRKYFTFFFPFSSLVHPPVQEQLRHDRPGAGLRLAAEARLDADHAEEVSCSRMLSETLWRPQDCNSSVVIVYLRAYRAERKAVQEIVEVLEGIWRDRQQKQQREPLRCSSVYLRALLCVTHLRWRTCSRT